jgi:hypothetical protein
MQDDQERVDAVGLALLYLIGDRTGLFRSGRPGERRVAVDDQDVVPESERLMGGL